MKISNSLREYRKPAISAAVFFTTLVSLSYAYAAFTALTNVNTGEPLTKNLWNTMVADVNDLDSRVSTISSNASAISSHKAMAQLNTTVSTTSTSWADVPGATVTVSTVAGGALSINWRAGSMQGLGTSGCRIHMRVLIDGSAVAGSTDEFNNNGMELRNVTIPYLATGLASGPHTVKAQWYIDTGTSASLNWHRTPNGWSWQTSELVAYELP